MPGFAEYDSYDALGLAELVRTGQAMARCGGGSSGQDRHLGDGPHGLHRSHRVVMGEGPFVSRPRAVACLVTNRPGRATLQAPS